MINKRFLRIQLKRLWIPILIFGIVVGAFTGVALGGQYIAPYSETIVNGSTSSGSFHNNALNLNVYYRSILFAFLLSYSFIALFRLLLVEQDRGYVGSWLTTPMTRWTIFATKYLAMIIGLLIIQVWVLLLQLILEGALMRDFSTYVGYIFLAHLSIFVSIFFFASLMWLIGSIFSKQWISVLIIVLILAWCGVASMLGVIGAPMPANSGYSWMKNMRYVSLFSLIHTPFEHTKSPEFTSVEGISLGEVLPIRALDYAWQLPVMSILGVGCFIGSQYILKNKDYNI